MSKFLDLIDKSVLVGDGAMGTLLVQELGPVRCVEEANLKNPEVVLGIHLKYIAAGARLIETNTFTANPGRLREVGLEDEVYEINSRAVKLAREARDISAQDVIIAGAIGPVGPAFDLLSPAGREEARRHHCRQVEILEQRGVEVFIAETMPSPRSLRLAVEAIRSVSSLPIIGQLTFPGEQFSDLDVTGVREAFEEVADLPVAVLGVNCGMGPRETLRILEQIPYRTHFRWSVFPNAGIPVRVAGRYMYPDSSPQYFGAWAAEAVRLGARIVGGCCGTRPETIAAIRAQW
jgi:homocysteine S-methyltransferase